MKNIKITKQPATTRVARKGTYTEAQGVVVEILGERFVAFKETLRMFGPEYWNITEPQTGLALVQSSYDRVFKTLKSAAEFGLLRIKHYGLPKYKEIVQEWLDTEEKKNVTV